MPHRLSALSFLSFALHPSLPFSFAFWVVIAEKEGGSGAGGWGGVMEGSSRTKQNTRGCTLVGFNNTELSHCLPAAVSVWCWERSIYSTQSYTLDCLSQPHLTAYITHQLSPYSTITLPGTPGYLNSHANFTPTRTWISQRPWHRLQLLYFCIGRICQTIPRVCTHTPTHTHLSDSITLY